MKVAKRLSIISSEKAESIKKYNAVGTPPEKARIDGISDSTSVGRKNRGKEN
ncbi:hypothetical protein [Brevibacillus centrosporus]|uniref:hypothetical protein n=1 Tax=Brevibacillus centrosporus TaxID=54910 RepID=UPI003801379F